MNDQLLYDSELTIDKIQSKVSSITEISVIEINKPDGNPLARKRETVVARQISIKLSKDYTKFSLATIGMAHGGRDHATVLHACKTINNLLDIRDPVVTLHYLRSKKSVDTFLEQQKLLNTVSQEDTIQNTEK